MFTVTPAAAGQIRKAAIDGGMAELALRVAARQEADGSITYGMGFDEPGDGEQASLQADGVSVLIAPVSQPLLEDTLLDFVELSPGEFNFIFVAQTEVPIDMSGERTANAQKPVSAGGCGSCASGGCSSRQSS